MDMDRYLSRRRAKESSEGGSFLSGLGKVKVKDVSEWGVFSLFRKKSDVVYEEDVSSVDDSFDDDFVDDESEIEAIDDLEDGLEVRREGVLRRFFKRLRIGFRGSSVDDEGVDDFEYVEEEVDDLEDIKEVIKITHRWLEELPPEVIERFKRSSDFEKYKQVLKKLGMIK